MSIEAIGALQEPVRRAVYEYAIGGGEPASRNEVAEALDIGRTLAAFHLDRLVAAGLLEVSFARRSGGPGAGRPAKLYRRAAAEHAVSLPPRRYLEAAGLLAEAVERAGADGLLFDGARDRGRSVGAAAGGVELVALLAGQGYEPQRRDDTIVLRNCPFHAIARDFPPLACGMSLALLEGLVEGAGRPGCVARMAPAVGRCCVVVDVHPDSKNNGS